MPRQKVLGPNEPPTEAELEASMQDPPTVTNAGGDDDDEGHEGPGPSVAEPNPNPLAPIHPPIKAGEKVTIGGVEYDAATVLAALKSHGTHRVKLADAKPSASGKMLTCDCLVKLNRLGSTVHRKGVTPAEMMFLVAEHNKEAGGVPIVSVTMTNEVSRTPNQEVRRLSQMYSAAKIKAMFPGAIPQVPQSFAEAAEFGLEAKLPQEKLLEFHVEETE